SQFAIPSFDAYLRDIFLPLCLGGTLCIPPDKPGVLDTKLLVDWIDHQKINLIHCVPSVFTGIVAEELSPKQFQSLKYVLQAGEILQVATVKKWRAIFGDRITLVNLYGSTETTMVKFFHVVQASDLERGFIPIGKPMKGARALLLDEHKHISARGLPGEIYIRSPFLT